MIDFQVKTTAYSHQRFHERWRKISEDNIVPHELIDTMSCHCSSNGNCPCHFNSIQSRVLIQGDATVILWTWTLHQDKQVRYVSFHWIFLPLYSDIFLKKNSFSGWKCNTWNRKSLEISLKFFHRHNLRSSTIVMLSNVKTLVKNRDYFNYIRQSRILVYKSTSDSTLFSVSAINKSIVSAPFSHLMNPSRTGRVEKTALIFSDCLHVCVVIIWSGNRTKLVVITLGVNQYDGFRQLAD